jgi:hypothetical protein
MTDVIHNTPDGKMRTTKDEKPHLWEEGKAGVLFLASRMASALPAEAIKDTRTRKGCKCRKTFFCVINPRAGFSN